MHRALRSLKLDSENAAPDHIQLARHIERLIRTGVLKEGQRLPSTSELIKIWGVNIARIQRAMGILVANGLLQRFPKRGTIVTSRALRPVIGILVGADLLPEVSQFDRVLAAALKNTLTDRKLNPQIYDSMGYPDTEAGQRSIEAIDYNLRHSVYTGFLLTSGLQTDYLPEFIRHYPNVTFGTPRKPTDVHIDHYHFITSSVNWLVARGCRKIAYFYGEKLGAPRYKLHITGFGEALEAGGLSLHPEAMVNMDQFTATPPTGPAAPDRCAYYHTLEVLKRWRKSRFNPDGIVIIDDIFARGVAAAIRFQWPAGSATPRTVVQTLEGVEHFYPMPMARYICSPRFLAETLVDRFIAKVVDKKEFSAPEAIKGSIVPEYL